MEGEHGQPDDLPDFERLAVNCFNFCEDSSVGSSAVGLSSLSFVTKDFESVQEWKGELESTTGCEAADEFLAPESIDSYFEDDIFVIEKNGQNINDCINVAVETKDLEIEIRVCQKEEGEIEEEEDDKKSPAAHGDAIPVKKEGGEIEEEEDCKKPPAAQGDAIPVMKEEGEIEEEEDDKKPPAAQGGSIPVKKEEGEIEEEEDNLKSPEAHPDGDATLVKKENGEMGEHDVKHEDEGTKLEREIDPAAVEVKNNDSCEEEDSEDAETDDEVSEEVSEEDDDSSEASYSEDDEEEDIEPMGNVTDTDEEADYNDYINPIRSTNELVTPPSVKSVDAKLQPHHQLLAIGLISSIVGAQVIVEGNELHNPLNEGSVLWITESKVPLGIIDEIFGPVKSPFYLVRFNSENEVPSQIQTGTSISFVEEFSKRILNNSVLIKKGYDASGENDEEVSDDGEFTDDEKEAEFRRKQKLSKRTFRDSKQKSDRNKAPKWKGNSYRPAANRPECFNTGTHFQPMGTPAWNGGSPCGPPLNSPLQYGIPPQNSPLPGCLPAHDLAWSAINQLAQNYRFPPINNFCGPPLNHGNYQFPPFNSSHVPAHQLDFAALNLAGLPPNPPPTRFPASIPGDFQAGQGFNPGCNPPFNFGARPNDNNRFRGRGRPPYP